MILVLAGTTEGREAAAALDKAGYEIVAAAVSSYGREILEEKSSVEIWEGSKDAGEMRELMRKRGVKLLVDATHPFAVNVTRNARKACLDLELPYLRLEREGAVSSREIRHSPYLLEEVEDVEEAVEKAHRIKGRIFLSVGSRTLDRFAAKLEKERLVARVLPTLESLQVCERLNFSPEQIIAARGPFSREFNRCMFQHYRVSALITRDSGSTGGLEEKISAAADLNLQVILIKRPPQPDDGTVFYSIEALKEQVSALLW